MKRTHRKYLERGDKIWKVTNQISYYLFTLATCDHPLTMVVFSLTSPDSSGNMSTEPSVRFCSIGVKIPPSSDKSTAMAASTQISLAVAIVYNS